ncbi:response regulator transcription factor [Clostridium sp.]|uniref:response regulator transcription factor n=1 Tax=Clostridium sp. TaxID=1506 RepID=UPI003D6D22F7
MSETLKVFILDNVKSITSRVKLLLNNNHYTVYEASNSTELFYVLAQNGYSADLIIMDIDLKNEDGFEIIKRLRKKNEIVPIMIMTANNNRDIFIRGISEGISDYILKPFENEILNNKILKLLSASHNLMEKKVIFNLPFFIQSEFKKATKGKYNVTIMMTTLYKPVKVFSNEIDTQYNEVSKYIFDILKSIFWDTDIFIRYSSQNFIGVFPFVSVENKDKISDKVDACFNELKLKDPKLKGYYLSNAFVTYPQDIKEDEDLFLTLITKTKEIIKSTKKDLQIY